MKTAVVTGASSGIGAATARALAGDGYRIVLGRAAWSGWRYWPAGGALGLEPVAEGDDERWLRMYEANVLGTMRMTRGLLPALRASADGHVVGVTSIAAFERYRGGAGYVAAKHAQRALLHTLRLELLGEPVRITEVAPGMVETEFSLVRFGGDAEAAERVYRGLEPLRAEDVAECIRWAVASTEPPARSDPACLTS